MPVEFWMGLLSTAFMVAFMLTAPLFGVLADRISRWKLMAFGVAVWSLASGAVRPGGRLSSLCLRLAAVVGVGEAAYGPAAPAVLSDLYPESRRGSILSYFYVAIPVGSALGYVLGGQMVAWTDDWRWAFLWSCRRVCCWRLLCSVHARTAARRGRPYDQTALTPRGAIT